MKPILACTTLVIAFLSGCATPENPQAERGPQGTIAYLVPVEASEPGTRIEVNYSIVGVAPLTIKIWGDKDGSFHNFGSDEYVVRAYPASTNYYPQTKIFKTGAFSVKDDRIPDKIFFDFSH